MRRLRGKLRYERLSLGYVCFRMQYMHLKYSWYLTEVDLCRTIFDNELSSGFICCAALQTTSFLNKTSLAQYLKNYKNIGTS